MNWKPSLMVVLVALFLVACGSGGNPPEPAVARVVVSPSSLLLTQAGESMQLTAQAYGADGKVMETDIIWRSLNTGTVTVSAEGMVTAVSGLGSAQIVAEAEGVSSAPTLALLAEPVPGALLVSDAQMVGEPEAVDDEADYGLGWQYRVTLSGVTPPSPGDILLASGEAPVGGRVVAVQELGPPVVVTLEVIPLDEMFAALAIDEAFDLAATDFDVPEEVADLYEVHRHPDGSIELVPRPDASSAQAGLTPAQASGTRALFRHCESTTPQPFDIVKMPALKLTPTLSFHVVHKGLSLEKLSVEGGVKAEFDLALSAEFKGKLTCKAELITLTIPIGGPLAFVLGGQVPLGIGFELDGAVTVAKVGLEMPLEAGKLFELGVTCPSSGDCDGISKLEATTKGEVKWVLPDPTSQFEAKASAYAFAFAELSIGTRAFKKLRIQAFEATAGLKQEIDLATPIAQMKDKDYASSYRLLLHAKAGPAGAIETFKKLLKIELKEINVTFDDILAESPKGSFTISPDTVQAGNDRQLGDTATFTVTLDPVTYLGAYVVEGIDIYWLKDGELADGRPGCTSLNATPNQTTFSCQTDFLEEHEGEQTFYAFARTSLFGVSLPVALELDKDALAQLTVSPAECPEAVPEVCEEEEETSLVTISGGAQLVSDVYFNVSEEGEQVCCYQMIEDDFISLSDLPPSGTSEFTHRLSDGATWEGTTVTTSLVSSQVVTANVGPSGGTISLDVDVNANAFMSNPPSQQEVGTFASARSSVWLEFRIKVRGAAASYSLSANVALSAELSEYSSPTRIRLSKEFDHDDIYGSTTIGEAGTLEPGSYTLRVSFTPETGVGSDDYDIASTFPESLEGKLELTFSVSQ